MYIFLSIISGILCALPFIKFSLFPIVWFSLVPFFIALYRSKNSKNAALLGYIFGIFFFGITLYWITELHHFVSFWAYLAWAVLIFCEAIFTAVFGFVLHRFFISKPSEYSRGVWSLLWIFAPAFIWTSLEWLRSLGPYGVTGGGLGYSQAFFIPLIQIASFTGVYGISFLIVFFNTVLVLLAIGQGNIFERFKALRMGGLVALGLIFLVLLYGSVITILSPLPEQGEQLRIALIQANVPQKEKLDFSLTNRIFDKHLKLSEQIISSHPDAIIWPETGVTDYLMENNVLLSKLRKFISKSRSYLVVGTPYFGDKGKAFNSLIAFSLDGDVINRYDKKHLVPFGEYLPLRPLFYPLLKYTGNLFEQDFDSNPLVKLLPVNGFVASATICFESTFPNIVRKRIRLGGDFILVSTNDAWFGNSPAAKQHFYSGVFRAIENRCYLVQVANTGISGVIDPYGRIAKRTKVGETTALNVSIDKRERETFYTKFGDLFVYLNLFVVLVLMLRRQMTINQ